MAFNLVFIWCKYLIFNPRYGVAKSSVTGIFFVRCERGTVELHTCVAQEKIGGHFKTPVLTVPGVIEILSVNPVSYIVTD